MSNINNVHDKYFRAAMSNLRVAREFMEQYLPKDILAAIDLSTLSLQKESLIGADLKQLISDVLYKAKIKGRDSYIYLLTEHQSTPDRLMAFRLLHYICRITAHHIENNRKDDLPIVVPLVFYHGQTIYSHGTNLFDLFGEFKELAASVLLKPFHLIDVNRIPDEKLKQQVWSGVLTFMQKHIYAEDLLKYIHDIVPLLKELMTAGEEEYIMSTIRYAMDAGNTDNIQGLVELTNKLSSELGSDEMPTISEQLKLQGKVEGKVEGRAEGVAAAIKAINLLSQGTDPAVISRITGLSPDIINALVLQERVKA